MPPRNQSLITLCCSNCGAQFEKYQSQVASNKKVFCTERCYHAYRIGRPVPARQHATTVRCAQCEKTFKRIPAKVARSELQFCSPACYGKWKSVNSTGPRSAAWKGGARKKYYGASWIKQREKARERDGYTCQCCGRTEKQMGKELDVHHISPFRLFGADRHTEANHIDNLISLCHKCHKGVEHGKIRLQLKLII